MQLICTNQAAFFVERHVSVFPGNVGIFYGRTSDLLLKSLLCSLIGVGALLAITKKTMGGAMCKTCRVRLKHAIGGLLALVTGGLWSGPAAADLVYNLSSNFGFSFTLEQPTLISVDTTFALSDFDAIVAPAGTIAVEIDDPLTSPEVVWVGPNGPFGAFFWTSAWTGPGTYCSGFGGCDEAAAIMTIRETSSISEPVTLALFGASIAGLAFARRRRGR